MYLSRRYAITTGTNSGLPDMKRIAIELNDRFYNGHQVRTNKALSSYAQKYF